MSNFDLEFRPSTYWPEEQSFEFKRSQIKGTMRREMAADLGEQLDPVLLKPSLSNEERERFGAMGPRFMSGEYLPDYETPETVEIARVELTSMTGDVISIRATRAEPNIRYTFVDEYDTRFSFEPRESQQALTMGEVIRMLGRATGSGSYREERVGLVDVWLNSNLEPRNDPAGLRDVVTVSSGFYPQLGGYYENTYQRVGEEDSF